MVLPFKIYFKSSTPGRSGHTLSHTRFFPISVACRDSDMQASEAVCPGWAQKPLWRSNSQRALFLAPARWPVATAASVSPWLRTNRSTSSSCSLTAGSQDSARWWLESRLEPWRNVQHCVTSTILTVAIAPNLSRSCLLRWCTFCPFLGPHSAGTPPLRSYGPLLPRSLPAKNFEWNVVGVSNNVSVRLSRSCGPQKKKNHDLDHIVFSNRVCLGGPCWPMTSEVSISLVLVKAEMSPLQSTKKLLEQRMGAASQCNDSDFGQQGGSVVTTRQLSSLWGVRAFGSRGQLWQEHPKGPNKMDGGSCCWWKQPESMTLVWQRRKPTQWTESKVKTPWTGPQLTNTFSPHWGPRCLE